MSDLNGRRLAVALTLKFCFCKTLFILGKKANNYYFHLIRVADPLLNTELNDSFTKLFQVFIITVKM